MDEPSGKNDSPYRLRRAKPLFVILRAKNRWRSTPDIEENISWTMTFPSGVLASCNSTYGAGMPGFYRVHGSQGMLHLENAFNYEGLLLRADINGAEPFMMPSPSPDPAHFAAEAEHFAECIQQDKQNKAPGEEGLRDIELMMRIYDSCKRHAG